MNVAVIFDTQQNQTEIKLAGKALFSYSFREYYKHPEIDGIAVLGLNEKSTADYVMELKREYGINKPVWMFAKKDDFWNELPKISGNKKTEVNLYVFHDICYPFAASDMIDKILQKAALYGSAVMIEKPSEEVILLKDGGMETYQESGTGDICFLKYPAAVRSDKMLVKKLEKINRSDEWLATFGTEQSYLCEMDRHFLKVCTKEEIELAEAILSV